MSFELFFGLRYLRAKRKQAFISVSTVISIVAVMVGVMSLIVVISVMNGFTADLISKILGVNAHVQVQSYTGSFQDYEKIMERIKNIDGVVSTTPLVFSQVMINFKGYASGSFLTGLDASTAGSVIGIEPMIKRGTLSSLNNDGNPIPGIIVGEVLARQIGAIPGDIVTVISPQGRLTPAGRVPSSQEFRIVGLYNSGMYDYDNILAYTSLSEAQDFLGIKGRVMSIGVKTRDPFKSDIIGEKIREMLGDPFWTQDWKVRNQSLLSALKLEKIVMFIILIIIILVGALNIISTLVMVVNEKTRDVAILRAMGATSKSVMKIFMLQGLLVGLVGTLAGLISGLGICHLISQYIHIDIPTDFYGLATLPVKVEALDVFLVTLAAFLISFLATIYPSWYASRLNPVEALRYE